MLIVISNPVIIAQEAEYINALFDEGLECLHLRKPRVRSDEIKKLLDEIDPINYEGISLHQHHFLSEEYSIRRLHFPEAIRKEKSDEHFYELKERGLVLSTSIHDLEDKTKLPCCFNYCLFGPVFDSISKQGYKSVTGEDFTIPDQHSVKIIAVGGINENNLTKAQHMGFDGVAVLGSVWNTGIDCVEQFKNLQQIWKQADQLH